MENLLHIKTGTGLEIDVDPSAYDDMELLDSCYEVQENNNFLALPAVLRHLLTEPARKALYAHIRAIHGRVRVEPLLDEIMDIMGQMSDARQDGSPAPTPAPEPSPEPEPLFPGPGPLPPFDKTQPPPAWHVDNVMAQLHGALHNSPGQADKLEKAARAALDVSKPASAWELLDKIEREISATAALQRAQDVVQAASADDRAAAVSLLADVSDALAGTLCRPSDPVPTGPQAVTADFVRAGTWPAPHCAPSDNAAKASESLTPEAWAAMEAQQAADGANSSAE